MTLSELNPQMVIDNHNKNLVNELDALVLNVKAKLRTGALTFNDPNNTNKGWNMSPSEFKALHGRYLK